MVGFRRCLKAAAAGMLVVTVAVTVLEMEVFYSLRGGNNGTGVRLQRSADIMINPAARLPNEGRLKRENGATVPELKSDVGTRSVHNGSHQRERQRWLKARAACILDGGGSDCLGEVDDTIPGAAGASAGAATTEAAAAAGPGLAAQLQSPRIVVDRNSGRAESGVGSGGGGGDASGRIRAGAGESRSMKIEGDAQERSPRSSDGSRSPNRTADPIPSPREGLSGGLVNAPPLPRASARDDRKGHTHTHDGVERSGQDVQVDTRVGVGVGAPAERNGVPRLLTGPESAMRTAVAADGGSGAVELPLEERVGRLETGIVLWGNTYVPPIAPDEKQRLIEKWTASAEERRENGTAPATDAAAGAQAGAPRILLVITSFDRGRRLGTKVSGVDKLDYVLMIMDEIREACEAGFSPHAHLISAWNARPELGLFTDRLFCQRTGETVPLTLEEHPPRIREVLAIKHRVYMKPRVQEFDLFLQLEDDMILTVNHFLLYLEESEKLSLRKEGGKPMYDFMPGFVRVEPEPGVTGVGGEWFEWEVILSRFRGVHVIGAGTYMTLEKSRVLPYPGNNQGFWMATQEQLKYLQRQCQYLRYTEKSSLPFVEKFSGSLEMFSPACHATKVFPATHFEDFMVHHRTNNKNGKRGESTPAVSVSMIRLWAAQVVRDDEMLMEVGDTGRRRPRRLRR